MKLELNRAESPYVFEVKNESGVICILDASEDIGGKNKGLTPMQLLASSLAGCMSIDVIMILEKQKINPKIFKIEIDAQKKEGTPSPFETIHFTFSIDKELDQNKIERAINLSIDKYCSVMATLTKDLNFSFEINLV